ncbi:histidine kinase [Roseateles sp. SL47]|uniref:histidine kinase n=1 Tax=Roseateles sp. SL47 TaxID=2995138 RepID=UPI0022709844|nr:histidine kinase [Roseateles sp. SL47]WAC71902.1 histidine kinase [Roseateles sp. SL47]
MRRRRITAQLVAGVLALFVWALPAFGQRHIEHFAWTDTRGAPGDVSAIAQSPEGLLWLATDRGLVRFDGENFHSVSLAPANPALPQNLSDVLMLPDGSLMVAYRSHGVAHYFPSTNQTVHYGPESGLPIARGMGFKSFQGTVLLPTLAGVYWQDGQRWVKWDFGPLVGRRFVDVVLAQDRGPLVLHTEDGHWFQAPSLGSPAQPAPTFNGVADVRLLPDGGRVMWMSNGELVQVDREGVIQHKRQLPLKVPNSFLLDTRGDLWASYVPGGVQWVPDVFDATKPLEPQRFDREAGMSGSVVFDLIDDHQGNVWAGTTIGLDRFSSVAVHPLAVPGRQSGAMMVAKCGGVWVTRQNLPPFLIRPDLSLHHTRGDREIALNGSSSALHARDGRLYVGGYERVWQLEGDSSRQLTPMPEAARTRLVQSMADSPDGRLWISLHDGGLWIWDGAAWSAVTDPLLSGASTVLTPTPTGLAVGFEDGRLMLVNNGVAQAATLPGDARGRLLALHAKGDHLWIGADRGVLLWRHGQATELVLDGDHLGRVTGIVESPDGALWLNEANDLIRISASALSTWMNAPDHPVLRERFGPLDGVHGGLHPNRNFPSLVQDVTGRLWIMRAGSLYWVDPDQLPQARIPLRPLVIQASVDDTPVFPPDRLVVESPEQQIRMVFAGTDLRNAVATQFRVMIEGLDKDWTPLGTHRRFAFGALAPGHYQLKVQAATPRQPWSEAQSAAVALEVRPAWHQTGWFRICVGLLVLLAATLIYRTRIGWLLRHSELRLEVKLKERESIARDLHDSLLQSIVAMVLHIQKSLKGLDSAHPVRLKVEQSLERAERVVEETREQLLGVRGGRPTLDLATLLRRDLQRSQLVMHLRPRRRRITVPSSHLSMRPIPQDSMCVLSRRCNRGCWGDCHLSGWTRWMGQEFVFELR